MQDYSNEKIQMVDLHSQYAKIQSEIDNAIIKAVRSCNFINGPEVKEFQSSLEGYLNVKCVIPCANGTDALQIALMALDLNKGDEIIVPAFTYVATAEVIALLGFKPIWVEVSPNTFNIDPISFKQAITPNTRAVVPVHLFGQCADMESVLNIAHKHGLYVIEDVAQAIGSIYKFSDGTQKRAGTMGDIGCTSFFPSKNLGCYGDGGAVYTNSEDLGKKIRMIANHGQSVKYKHDLVGINSRLDTVQAAILNVKLQYLEDYNNSRSIAAQTYDKHLEEIPRIQTPKRNLNSTHVFHQYTLIVDEGQRDNLKKYLMENGVPAMVYYPIPMHMQAAYISASYPKGSFPISEHLSESVLSLPMHTELKEEQIEKITNLIKRFYERN